MVQGETLGNQQNYCGKLQHLQSAALVRRGEEYAAACRRVHDADRWCERHRHGRVQLREPVEGKGTGFIGDLGSRSVGRYVKYPGQLDESADEAKTPGGPFAQI